MKQVKQKLTVWFFATMLSTLANAQFNSIIPDNTATHKAVESGDWNDPDTWSSGTVPGTSAIVIIPMGVSVNYNVNSNAHIFAIRNDGKMTFEAPLGVTRKLIVDTYLNGMMSNLIMKADNPSDGNIAVIFKPFDIEAKKRGEISGNNWNANAKSHYSDGKPVNDMFGNPLFDGPGVLGRYQWDSTQITLGLMSMSTVVIEGQDKSDFLRTTSTTPRNRNSVNLESAPLNWKVGDDVVLSGTRIIRTFDDSHPRGTEDEEFEIATIDGNTITFNSNTAYIHKGIEDENLFCHLSNLTRNIAFRSSNTSVTKRGHVMFMRTTDVKVHNASFKDLGRTDKYNILDDYQYDVIRSGTDDLGRPIIDIRNVGGKASPENIENQRGRYAFHFHRMKDDITRLAEAHGCVIWGSPGWGMVHHDSHASFVDNVVYSINGAGMIGESGSETGIWEHNLVTSIIPDFSLQKVSDLERDVGLNKKTGDILDDDFRIGDGYACSGRAIRMVNNVCSSTFEAFVYESSGSLEELRDQVRTDVYPIDMFPLQETVDRAVPPLLEFDGNESYGCASGFRSRFRADFATHHVLSIVDNYTEWNVNRALYITTNFAYMVRNGRFFNGTRAGLFAPNVDNINVVNTTYYNWSGRGFDDAPRDYLDPEARMNFVNVKMPGFEARFDDLTYGGFHVYDDFDATTPRNFPITLARGPLMDTRINVNTNDYKVAISGTITDRLGDYNFGYVYKNAFPDVDKRVYDFKDRTGLDAYLATYGVFTDEIGSYTFLTEFISDRATGDITPVRFKIRLVGVDAGDINTPPVVSFESPSPMQMFTEGSNIPTIVNAIDDGSIASVTLYVDGEIVRDDVTAPYQWSNSPVLVGLSVGMHTLKAVATDDEGATSEVTRMIMIEASSVEDCAGVADGTASLDDCGVCSGGTTGVTPGTLKTWYEDADGDGSGDPLSSLEDCSRPSGYVRNSNDECPLHADKITPGDCGCDTPEEECFVTGVCDAPSYKSGTIYSTVGSKVIYRGKLYKNKWYANSSNVPGNTSGPWELIDFCGATPLDCSLIEPWDASKTYNTSGILVEYNGKQYESVHWTKNNEPGSHSSWRYSGQCEVSLAPVSVPNFATGYPNPLLGDEITVAFAIPVTGATYQLTDPLGNVLLSGTVPNGASEIIISLEDVPSRNYNLKVTGDNINDVILVSVVR